MKNFYTFILSILGLGLFAQNPSMKYVSRFETGLFDEAAAEIVAYSEIKNRIYFSNSFSNSVTILDASVPSNPQLYKTISLAAYGGIVNSVAVKGNMVAVAAEDNIKQNNGKIVFFDLDGNFLNQVTVGALPDMVTISPDGNYVMSANEGEPDADYLVNPKGSVSIIDVSGGLFSLTQANVTTLDFTAFDGQTILGGRVGANTELKLVDRDFEEPGDTLLPDFTIYSGASNIDWYYDSFSGDNFAEMNGIGANAASEDWLISTGINLSSFMGAQLSFNSAKGFSGPDIEVLVSTNYTSGDPNLATWDTLSPSLSSGSYNEVFSGNLDLSNYLTNNTSIAFLYLSTGTGSGAAATWQIDDILVEGLGTILSNDIEPEYVAINASSDTAYVSCQENNILAIIDINNKSIVGLKGLGYKDHSLAANALDPSDKDSINIRTMPNLFGVYMPDAIKAFRAGNKNYIISANEGDGREYEGEPGFVDEDRVKDLDLDSAAFAAYPNIQDDNELGRLTVMLDKGDTDGDGDYDELYAYGARSFSIWDAQGNLVFDSGDDIERVIADSLPQYFGFSNDDNDAGDFDSRSDAKGPEPEAVEVAEINGKIYAWIGLERIGGVMMYEITNPTNPTFIQYINTRNFTVDADSSAAGDLGPEDIKFIRADKSPDGKDYILVSNEVSGTISIIEVKGLPKPNFELQILHASDLEGGVDAIDRAPNFAALADKFEDEVKNSITLSSGDNYIPGPFFNAASQGGGIQDTLRSVYNEFYNTNTLTDLRTDNGRVDISIMNVIGFNASTIGNHEFDAGPSVMATIIGADIRNSGTQARWLGSQFPYLSANLNFSNEPALAGLYESQVLPVDSFVGNINNFNQVANRKKIAPATIIERSGEKVGVVAATTQVINSISSTGGVAETTGGANDMNALAALLQPIINDMVNNKGVNKIIVSSHLQQFALEQQLAGLLNNVDIIIAGGSDFLLADGNDVLRPGDVKAGNYPFLTQDALGNPLAIISTDGQYSYLGRLVVEFDTNGVLIPSSIDSLKSGAFASLTSVVNTAYATSGNPFAKGTKGRLVEKLVTSVKDIVTAKDGNIFGQTTVYLEGRRSAVRTEETNLGNLSSDANLWAAKQHDPAVMVSLKNGGGIRAEIGVIDEVSPGVYDLLPPQANPISGKDSLEISQLDIENSLRFNNQLSIVELTASGLRDIVEYGVSAAGPGNTPGQFPQVGGIAFSYDTTQALGSQIQSMVIIDSVGNYLDTIVRKGNLIGNPNRTIKMVTLNFLAGGGDGYPFASLSSNRVDLDTALTAAGNATFTNPGSEQDALAEYLLAKHNSLATAFGNEETKITEDFRIELLNTRDDAIFPDLSVLLSPANGSILDIEGPSTQLLIPTWTSNGKTGTNYVWQLSDPLGNPLLTIPTGTDTFIVFDFASLDDLLAAGGVSIGGSIPVRWNVFAANGTDTTLSENGPYSIIMRRKVVTRPYDLVSPSDGTTLAVQGDPTQTVDYTWESVKHARGNGDVNYTWLLDVVNGDFSNPLAAVPSNNSGNDTTLTLDFATIVSVLNANNVAVGNTFNGKWTVVATVPNVGNDTSISVYTINLERNEMTSVNEVFTNANVLVYPNPANNRISVIANQAQIENITILNSMGQEVYRNVNPTSNTAIELNNLSSGIYFVKVTSGNKEVIQKLQIVK